MLIIKGNQGGGEYYMENPLYFPLSVSGNLKLPYEIKSVNFFKVYCDRIGIKPHTFQGVFQKNVSSILKRLLP